MEGAEAEPAAAAAAAAPLPPEPEAAAAASAPLPPEPEEAPGDAGAAKGAEGSPSSTVEVRPAEEEAEEGAAAAAAVVEEKPLEPCAEEPPALEGASEAGPAEEQPEGAALSEGQGEEPEQEGEKAAEEGGEGLPAAAAAEQEAGLPREAASNVTLLAGLPTSVSFSKGELDEPPPLQVGVELGRRISRSLWELDQKRLSSASVSTGPSPDSDKGEERDEETEEQLDERLAEQQRQRAELAEQYRQLLAERVRLRHYNTKLQGKLGELLNKGKERARAELEQRISDQEQRYSRYLTMLEELRSQQVDERAWYQKQIHVLQRSCEEKLAKVDREWKACLAVKKEVAVYTMGRQLGGKQAAVQEVDHIQAREQNKEKEMTEVRLENIKLKHRIQKLEASLKAQEELAEGLHLIDFEQLKIENQTYNEKIEERNEELLKLQRKITNTVQVLTQVKEKLQFVEAQNQGQKVQLMAVEALVAQKRDILTKTKQARDKLRMDNQRLHQKCGLLGNTLLLRDFEDKVATAELLNERLAILKRHHAGLCLTCKGVKKKIKGVKSFLPF